MKKLNKKGFTLMELIVVIAIIAVLMLILVPTMGGFVDQAKKEANLANAKAAYTAAIAQQTALNASLKPDSNTYEFDIETDNTMDCGNLHSDFFEATGGDTCTINFTTGGKVVSVTYGADEKGDGGVTYPDDAD